MKVYCVFVDYNYEGGELEHIFAKEEDADKYIAENSNYYHLVKEEWTII
jgi:hypothetical protein